MKREFLDGLIDLPSFNPKSLKFPAAWAGHLPFAAWLINELSPNVFVELGTHTGNSYFSFCQIVQEKKLITKCFAVDTWQGDDHSGGYGEEIFEAVNEHHESNYSGFSRLLRMTFDEAVNTFPDHSIDLLHIDGLHTYEAVKHDFETWLPKMSSGGIILFHDTNVRERGFGVWKLWDELIKLYPHSMEFVHSHGLGVLQVSPAISGSYCEWLRPDFEYHSRVKKFFASLGDSLIKKLELDEGKKRVQDLEVKLFSANKNILSLQERVTELGAESNHQHHIASRLASENNHYLHQSENLRQQINALLSSNNALLSSNSWRITKPLRELGDNFRLIHGKLGLLGNLTKFSIPEMFVLGKKSIKIISSRGFSAFVYASQRKLESVAKLSKFEVPISDIPLIQRKIRKTSKKINPELDRNSINYYGYICAVSGLGSACRGCINILREAGMAVYPLNIPCGLPEVDFETTKTPNPSAAISFIHMNADSMDYFFSKVDPENIVKTYNIGLWVWEFSAFDAQWFKSFEILDEIWVPSEFCRESVQAISPIPVHVIPYLLNKRAHSESGSERQYLKLPDGIFLFGYVFDCSSSILRKNPFALINAFKQCFQSNRNAGLVLKFSNGSKDPQLYDLLRESIAGCENIYTIEQELSETELEIFYSAIDCYVSPHRSEGFGLTITEAMLAGKPVIATNYGGSTDFVLPEHSYPVQYSLINVSQEYGPYKKDYLWADPDADDLAKKMLDVYAKKSHARLMGNRAQSFVKKYYSFAAIRKKVTKRLGEIVAESASI